MQRSIEILGVVAIILPVVVNTGARQSAARTSDPYPETRHVDAGTEFPNVGALVTVAEKNDAGVPEGLLGKCTGTLIHERVVLTAGHCICPALPAPPPFARISMTFDANALDQSKWRRVVKVAGHASLLACSPPDFSSAWPHPPVAGLSDVGLVFLADPVNDRKPAPLAPLDVLNAASSARADMTIVGYGHLQPVPRERESIDWDGRRRVRTKRLAQVIDGTWATWQLPAEVCGGDSGGPIFLDGRIVATVSFVGRQCREASIHTRIDVPSVQTWIRNTITSTMPTLQ